MIRIEVNKKELKNMMEVLKTCVSKDELRPVFQGINIRKKDEKIYFSASDGFRIGIFEVNCRFEWNDDIDRFTIETFDLNNKENDINVIITKNDNILEITEPSKTTQIKVKDGEFFDTLQYITEFENLKSNEEIIDRNVFFNPLYLETIYKLGKEYKKERLHTEFVLGKNKISPFYLYSYNDTFKFYNLILPLRKTK